MVRFTTWTTSSPRHPTTTHKCVPCTQRDTSIDGEHRTVTKGVLGALVIDDAFYRMYHTIVETSCYHP